MKEIKTEKIPIKLWLEEVDQATEKQARNIANLPGAWHHVAIMPDAHVGYGMPIGGVLATEGTIVPNAVGVDIGCGMITVKTTLTEIGKSELKEIIHEFTRLIPSGFHHHKTAQEWKGFDRAPDIGVIQRELSSARKQIGTLGGGNHFVEILREIEDEEWRIKSGQNLWLMIHSGSRNFGLKAASEYHRRAQDYCLEKKIELPDRDLAFLPFDSKLGQEYFRAMSFAQEFARANREMMMRRIMKAFQGFTGCGFVDIKTGGDLSSGSFPPHLKKVRVQDDNRKNEPWIGIHHNYAAAEEHFGRKVIVHRKGAVRSGEGELGILPGSMGTPSYITRGQGNPESFFSSAHGAGRALGRKQAMRELTREQADAAVRDVVFTGWRGKWDEAPQAYKDIETVAEAQKDLAEPIVKLKPLAVMIGN